MEERRQTGVYVSCTYQDDSLTQLGEWMTSLCIVIPMPTPLDQVHTTIVYSRQDFDCPIGEEINISNPRPFCPTGFALLGKPEDEQACLVMLLDADPLINIHNFLVDQGARHDYDDYIPHVTLSYQVPKDFNHQDIPIPSFCLTPKKIKFEPLNINWCVQDSEVMI